MKIGDTHSLRNAKTSRLLGVRPADAEQSQQLFEMRRVMRTFAALARERSELNARLKLVEAQMQELAPQIADFLEEHGKEYGKNIDGMTVYTTYRLWARPKDNDLARLVEALRRTHWRELIHETVNIPELSKLVKEALSDAARAGVPEREALPGDLFDVLDIVVDRHVQARSTRKEHDDGE